MSVCIVLVNADLEKQIPIFPLPLVLFPGAVLPLHIFEPRYLKMLDDITVEGQPQEFGVTFYMESSTQNLGVTTAVGTIAQVREVMEVSLEALDELNEPGETKQLNLIALGTQRFRIVSVNSEQEPYLLAKVELFDDAEEQPLVDSELTAILGSFREMLRLNEKVSPDNKATDIPDDISAFDLGYLIGQHLNHDMAFQQALLEINSLNERLTKAHQYIQPIIQKLAAMIQINAAFEDFE